MPPCQSRHMHTLCNTHEAWFVTADGRRTHTGTHLRTHCERPRGTLTAANHGWDGGGLTLWSFSISYAGFFFFFFLNHLTALCGIMIKHFWWDRQLGAGKKRQVRKCPVATSASTAWKWGKLVYHPVFGANRHTAYHTYPHQRHGHATVRRSVTPYWGLAQSPGPSGGLMTPACPPHSYPDNFRSCRPGTTQGHLCP